MCASNPFFTIQVVVEFIACELHVIVISMT
jgi:hypothetical protein